MVPEGPLVLPGTYQVKLTVAGRSYTAPLEVQMDPRVDVAPIALAQQLELEMKIIEGMNQSYAAVRQIRDLRRRLKELQTKLASDTGAKPVLDAINIVDTGAAELLAVEQQYPPVGIVSIASLNGAFASLLPSVEGADSAPTAPSTDAVTTYRQLLDEQLAKWVALKANDLPALNELLQQRQIATITIKD